jgi:hypothetical protein
MVSKKDHVFPIPKPVSQIKKQLPIREEIAGSIIIINPYLWLSSQGIKKVKQTMITTP